MSDFSHTRRWWPSFLLEEVMPEGRENPQDWLAPDADGITTVFWDEDEDETGNTAGTISPGETVTFCWQENRGRVTIRIMPDGTWSLAEARCSETSDLFNGEAAAPEPFAATVHEANQFWEPDEWESCGDTMDEFARCRAANEPPAAEGDLVEVAMGFWSHDVMFVVSADGRSLEPVGVRN